MGMPLAAGHVLVRVAADPQEAAEAVLDALEAAFPTHTGRGRTRIGNVWEDPPTLTSEGTRVVAEPRPGSGGAPTTAPGPSRGPSARPPAGAGPSASLSQTFDAHSEAAPGRPVALAADVGAEVLGRPEDVERVLRALSGRCRAHQVHREEHGPQLAVRLRLGPHG
ncbi:hypothetical protein [Streptomyces sp. NRRL S-350]|uniref:hypothetical protein n=1 Tax=Streptomyces sp. NRRL S-350 TaxID=1463902 RepID=UPI0004BFE316|nr:hypothetical protein [Streptomyces sp. NRRL S-350]